MHENERLYLEHRRRMSMRPDAHLYRRPDHALSLKPVHPDARTARPAPSGEAAASAQLPGEGISEADLLDLRAMLSDLKLDLVLQRLRRKYSPDQPRVPAGNPDGGQWTSGGGGANRPAELRPVRPRPARTRLAVLNDPAVMSDAPPPGVPAAQYAENVAGRPGSRSAGPPVDVVLPDGSKIPDKDSPTGFMRAPVADLAEVARAGRETGRAFLSLLGDPANPVVAFDFLFRSLRRDLAQGGTFDYQRERNETGEYNQLREYRNVSNFNVGLYNQQAGLSLEATLTIAGAYARLKSGNADPAEPYGLAREQRDFIEHGFRAGQSGAFDSLR